MAILNPPWQLAYGHIPLFRARPNCLGESRWYGSKDTVLREIGLRVTCIMLSLQVFTAERLMNRFGVTLPKG